jgi:hypothetical protein
LCNIFEVKGKISNYIPEFNNLSLFNNSELLSKFIDYSIQDSISLYNALKKAQEIYLLEHNVDITTIYSTSTLFLLKFVDDVCILRVLILWCKLPDILSLIILEFNFICLLTNKSIFQTNILLILNYV